MSTKELMHFRSLLISGRGEILDRMHRLGAALRDLSEPEIELQEEAQKASLSDALDRLGANGRVNIDLIDLALRKMAVGEYGVCESCGDDISSRRLEVLPWTRLCVECARELEKRPAMMPQPSDFNITAKLPEEYQNVNAGQVVKSIYEHVDKYIEADRQSVRINIRNGVVYIEGSIGTEMEHQVVLQTLTDEMGFEAVVDLLHVEETSWEEEGGRSRSHYLH